jgi:putative thiamine transport system ATP-binding protein
VTGRGSLMIDGLSVALAGRRLVSLDLVVGPGEMAVLRGPSGVGKSTLLAAIAGTIEPVFGVTGSIRIGDERIERLPPERRGVGLIFQDDLLFPHLSVGRNLAFGLAERLRGRAERRRAIEDALRRCGLEGFGERDPATLSGGQRARVALMRALLAEPRALLLDEPFAALDPALRERMRAFVTDELARLAIPAILVTHDLDDAGLAGPVVHLQPG